MELTAQYILATTKAKELSVMGYINGSVKIFAMSSQDVEDHEDLKLKVTKHLFQILQILNTIIIQNLGKLL